MPPFDFPLKVENLDNVPEAYKGLYSEGDDGHDLDKDLGAMITDAGKQKESLTKERKKAGELNSKLKAYGDHTPESITEMQTKIEELQDTIDSNSIDGGDKDALEKVVNERTERLRTGHDREVKKLNERIAELEGEGKTSLETIRTLTVDQKVTAAAVKAGVQEHSIDDAVRHGRNVFDVDFDEGKPVVKPGIEQDPSLTVSSWMEDMLTQKPGWTFKPESKGGNITGGGGLLNSGNLKRSEMSSTQKAEYTKKHGHEEFLKLPL